MPLPRIAIVGRPNAGKSSLLNMIAKAKVSIVDPTPGVTRDRVTVIADLEAPIKDKGEIKSAEFVDTGGFGVYVADGERFDEVGADLAKLTESIEFQINQAVDGAELILFAVDCQQGITPADEEIARLLREGVYGRTRHAGVKKRAQAKAQAKTKAKAQANAQSQSTTPPLPANARRSPARIADDQPELPPPSAAPVIRVVATKCDGPKWEAHAMELAALGFGEPLLVSAKSNYFRRDFLDALYDAIPEPKAEAKEPPADLMLAIVGKRNAGKSSLVNQIAGGPRMIVSEIAGTTRDAVDVRLDWNGKSMIVIDTAGLRRKRSFQNAIEHYAFDRMHRAIERADVAILLLDATEAISQVDEQLAHMIRKSFKPVVIVVNKWDLVEGRNDEKGKPITPERYEEYIRRELRGLPWAPISFISAETGRNIRKTIDLTFELKAQCEQRVTTGKLNRLVRTLIERQGPSDTVGTFAKVFYVAQTGIAPPTVTLVVNKPELFRPNYLRFLENRFREELPYAEVPMRIVIRARRQREDDLATTGDGGEEGSVRVARGRKNTDARARKRLHELRAADQPLNEGPIDGEFDESILNDEHSLPVHLANDLEQSNDADEYFEDED